MPSCPSSCRRRTNHWPKTRSGTRCPARPAGAARAARPTPWTPSSTPPGTCCAGAGPVRLLHRGWRLVLEPERIERSPAALSPSDEVLRRRTHQAIRKVTDDYTSFAFNTAVSALMELANAVQEHVAGGGELGDTWRESVDALLLLLHPMAPHVTEELWERTGHAGLCADAAWPAYNPAAAADPTITLVVQVGGKVRDRLELPAC